MRHQDQQNAAFMAWHASSARLVRLERALADALAQGRPRAESDALQASVASLTTATRDLYESASAATRANKLTPGRRRVRYP